MPYAFFWAIPRRLQFICQRFATLCPIFRGTYEDGTDRIAQKKSYKTLPTYIENVYSTIEITLTVSQ
jgi:hypothetical protein